MRPLLEQNYYEILEVAPEGTPAQIERAYHIARATYQPASAATYSIFNDEANEAILERIEEAYSVLSDEETRHEYDERLRREASLRAATQPKRPGVATAPLRDEAPPAAGALPIEFAGGSSEPEEFARLVDRAQPSQAPAQDSTEQLADGLEPEDGIYDGAVLRRIRMSQGLDLLEISQRTKVNPEHLQNIEEDRFEQLPAAVYVRGFVKEYARCLGLDAGRVAQSYYTLVTATAGAVR